MLNSCDTAFSTAGLASTKHEATMWYTLAVYFTFGVGPCMGLVEPFKHLLCVTAHPQFLALARDNVVYVDMVSNPLYYIVHTYPLLSISRPECSFGKRQKWCGSMIQTPAHYNICMRNLNWFILALQRFLWKLLAPTLILLLVFS